MRNVHDLSYLFQLLPQIYKNILTASIKKDCTLNDAIFQDGLNSIADTFNKQRYQFSNYNQDLSTHIMFAPFVHTMCKFALEILLPKNNLGSVYSSQARMAAQMAIQRTCTAAIKASEVLA